MYERLIVDIAYTDKNLYIDLTKLYNTLELLRERLNTNINEDFLVEYAGERGKIEILIATKNVYASILEKLYE